MSNVFFVYVLSCNFEKTLLTLLRLSEFSKVLSVVEG